MLMMPAITPPGDKKHCARGKTEDQNRPNENERFDGHHSRNLPRDALPARCKITPPAPQAAAAMNMTGKGVGNADNP
jgi:hypothetical protein